jgi:hypothetical protein
MTICSPDDHAIRTLLILSSGRSLLGKTTEDQLRLRCRKDRERFPFECNAILAHKAESLSLLQLTRACCYLQEEAKRLLTRPSNELLRYLWF